MALRNLLCLATIVCCFAATHAVASPPPGYYLVWSDEFNGTSLDPTKWWAWNQLDRSGYAVPDAVTVGDGYLTIHTYSTNGSNFSAIISSDGRFRARYGYAEASVEFNGSPGMFSDFWMNSANNGQFVGDPAAEGVEVDVCEHRVTTTNNIGDLSGQVTIDLHWDGYTKGIEHTATSGLVGSGLGAGFHTYGLLWNSTNYTVNIDGTNMWSTNAGISQRTEVIMFSSEVDSNSFCGIVPTNGYGNFQTSTTSTVVDYLRVYAPTTTLYWIGASSANLMDSNNWLSNMIPAAASDLVFSMLSVGDFNITLPQNTAVNSLSIQEAPAVSITGNTFTVNSGGIDMLSANANATINSAIVLNAAQSWSIGLNLALIVTGPVGGTGALTLDGQGTVVLEGTNTASGPVTIKNGTLLFYNTINNAVTLAGGMLTGSGTVFGPVNVNSGTLGGTETITGPVVVNAAGTLAPGSGIGTLVISNSLTLQPGSITSMDVNKTAATNDQVVGLSSLNYGGTLSINNQGTAFAPGDAFKLFDAASYTGAFGRITPITPGTNLAWNTSTLATDGTLRVVSTISSNVTASLAANRLALSWPANNLGWLLQTQTNTSPAPGLSSNWVTISNSVATNQLVMNIDPTVGSAFYRLALPTTSTTATFFSHGDIVVLRVGNGSVDTSGAPGFLHDYLPTGGALQTQLALPTSGSDSLIFGGSSYDGSLALSADGKAIVVGGYNVPLGSFSGTIDTSSATTVPRAVGSINSAGIFTLGPTTTQFSGATIRSAVADGAGNFWAGGGSSGVVYLGNNSAPATLSTISPATRNLNFVNGNLCFTETGSGDGVMAFIGAPKTATTPSILVNTAGTGTGTPSPKGFAFNSALTIAYVADNRTAATGGGIQRFNWNGSAWVYAYTLGNTLTSSKEIYDIIVDFSGPNPVLYAVTGESTGNHLVKITDTGAGSSYTSLETAPSGDAFRGLVFAP